MLKKAHRLSTKQFMEVMEKGRVITSPLFVVRTLENSKSRAQSSNFGAGLSAVAPKKIARTAALRNRMRRQIYAAVSSLVATIKPNVSLIIFAKQEALQADVEAMEADLKQLFSKMKISV